MALATSKTQLRRIARNALKAAMEMQKIALDTEEQNKHLARMLTYLVAKHGGGRLELDDRQMSAMPDNVQLLEHYDVATDCVVLRTAVPKDDGSVDPDPIEEGLLPATAALLDETVLKPDFDRMLQPNTPVPAFDALGQPIQHQGPAIPGAAE